MPTNYTREDIHKILQGLGSGKPAKPHPTMSDAAFRAMYDPQGHYERKVLAALEDIKQAMYRAY
jgi:hypothetical protein|tara:strand:+ start:2090 stop:2281 length:192 start_codon:yes stop_codon:yes gene_type:complete